MTRGGAAEAASGTVDRAGRPGHGGGAGLLAASVGSVAVLGAATAGMLAGVEPWATWFYPLAWYPSLVLAEAFLRRRRGAGYLSADPAFARSLLLWSVPFWLLFELINFRVANWYYVFLPPTLPERWAGVVISFATVLPAVLVAREVAQHLGVGRTLEWRPLRVRAALPGVLQAVGVAFVALSLVWPRLFFPLVWGAVTLLLDPWVYRRDPERSLLGALERGRPAVVVQLLAGGLAIGFLWELYNVAARGKWIYTVPGLEELKLFEMPLLGFLGFPVLALDAWAVWNALVLKGLAPDAPRGGRPSRRLHGAAARGEAPGVAPSAPSLLRPAILVATATACVAVLAGMERWTITSTRPTLDQVAGSAETALRGAGYDAFTLAAADPGALARRVGVDPAMAEEWVRRARLATLRGIGADNVDRLDAVGVGTVEKLAASDPRDLAHSLGMTRAVAPARLRVWIRAASDQAGRAPDPRPTEGG